MQTTNTIRSIGFKAYLATQFLGAFNDNVFKLLLICYATNTLGHDTPAAQRFVSLAGALFILPYLLCSSYAGFLADRFSKRSVMIASKTAEVAIMLAGALFFYRHSLNLLLFVLFCMGMQSAFFSPAKYGFLPEILPEHQLSRGNGATQLFTFLAIVFGSGVGGLLASRHIQTPHLAALFCVAFAVFGLFTSFSIHPTPPGTPGLRCRIDPFSMHWRTFMEMKRDRLLLLMLGGNAYFWFLGTLFQLTLVFLAKSVLAGGDAMVGTLQMAAAAGIGCGCALAGLLSRRNIEYGLILPGGILTGLAAILLGLLGTTAPRAYLLVAMVGLFCGMFQLPMVTAIQHRSPEHKRGKYLAVANACDCLAMIAAALTQGILMEHFHLSASAVMICAGSLTLAMLTAMGLQAPALRSRTLSLFRR